MDFFNDLQRLATTSPSARRNELLALLREMDCPFILFHEHLADYRPENIVIRFREEAPQRFVIGAHYDSVPGSTGANDNGAGVCVLLTWLRSALHRPPPFPVDVVFFDLEELGQIGSRAYVERFAPVKRLKHPRCRKSCVGWKASSSSLKVGKERVPLSCIQAPHRLSQATSTKPVRDPRLSNHRFLTACP